MDKQTNKNLYHIHLHNIIGNKNCFIDNIIIKKKIILFNILHKINPKEFLQIN